MKKIIAYLLVSILFSVIGHTAVFASNSTLDCYHKQKQVSNNKNSNKEFYFKGTVTTPSFNDEIFIIQASNGTIYDPMNLLKEYHKAGLHVEVTAIEQEDLAGINMVGKIIKIISVSAAQNE